MGCGDSNGKGSIALAEGFFRFCCFLLFNSGLVKHGEGEGGENGGPAGWVPLLTASLGTIRIRVFLTLHYSSKELAILPFLSFFFLPGKRSCG